LLIGGDKKRSNKNHYFRWGLGVLLGVIVSGGVSGGHLNPAVSVALATIGKFPWRKVPTGFF
jgi:glycerol uptake facilitator-like aquaporin